jgi:hypothetical protein
LALLGGVVKGEGRFFFALFLFAPPGISISPWGFIHGEAESKAYLGEARPVVEKHCGEARPI